MNSLTPFVRHALTLPDPGFLPPSPPDDPNVQLPPPSVQTQSAAPPDPPPAPDAPIPMTDGTPAACRQKNAAAFLAGEVPGVMAQYGGQLFGTEQNLDTASPAPEEPDPAQSGVLDLVDWREDAPYG